MFVLLGSESMWVVCGSWSGVQQLWLRRGQVGDVGVGVVFRVHGLHLLGLGRCWVELGQVGDGAVHGDWCWSALGSGLQNLGNLDKDYGGGHSWLGSLLQGVCAHQLQGWVAPSG